MRRLILLIAAAASFSGCVAMGGSGEGTSIIDPMDNQAKAYDFQTTPSVFSRVGNAVLSVPETALWWPYKIASSAFRGGYDGVSGGVSRAPMPIVGLVASPLTAVAGMVNGTLAGVARGPAYVGSTDEFGAALGKPWTEPIPLFRARGR
jgi:hypothetical protein